MCVLLCHDVAVGNTKPMLKAAEHVLGVEKAEMQGQASCLQHCELQCIKQPVVFPIVVQAPQHDFHMYAMVSSWV